MLPAIRGGEIVLLPTRVLADAGLALPILLRELAGHGNDASWIRATQSREHLLNEVVRRQTLKWAGRDERHPLER